MQHVQLEAAKVVGKVMHDGYNLTQVLVETLSKRSDFTAQERGALQDLCYGTIRFYKRLSSILEALLQRRLQDAQLRYLLLVAIYQLQHTRAGKHVIVDQAVCAAKTVNSAGSGLVNAVLRNFLRKQTELLELADKKEESRYAYQQWWIEALKAQYGEKAIAIMESGNQHPPMTLRVNVRHTTATEYLELLTQQGIAGRHAEPNAVIVENPLPVERLPKFREGWVSIQDAGAQYAAKLLDVRSGMLVLDACAAPGGKTSHLLEIENIELIALDNDEKRLNRISENLQRLQLHANVICGNAAEPQRWWDGRFFQRILADVPCSASGVVRRHPDIKWLRRPQDINGFALQQARILDSLWSMLAGDGKLLYATCSIFTCENQQVVDAFLLHHEDAEQIVLNAGGMTDGQLLPDDEHDGFFYALLHKKN